MALSFGVRVMMEAFWSGVLAVLITSNYALPSEWA
jgi:hypothetical protein